MQLPTVEQVHRQIGLSRKKARQWGVEYPLKAGWKERLIAQIVASQNRTINAHRDKMSAERQAQFDRLRAAVDDAEALVAQAEAIAQEAKRNLAAFVRKGGR